MRIIFSKRNNNGRGWTSRCYAGLSPYRKYDDIAKTIHITIFLRIISYFRKFQSLAVETMYWRKQRVSKIHSKFLNRKFRPRKILWCPKIMFLFIFFLVRKIGLFFGFEICDAKSVCFLESGGARLRDDNSFTNFNHLNKLNFMFTANHRKT